MVDVTRWMSSGAMSYGEPFSANEISYTCLQSQKVCDWRKWCHTAGYLHAQMIEVETVFLRDQNPVCSNLVIISPRKTIIGCEFKSARARNRRDSYHTEICTRNRIENLSTAEEKAVSVVEQFMSPSKFLRQPRGDCWP